MQSAMVDDDAQNASLMSMQYLGMLFEATQSDHIARVGRNTTCGAWPDGDVLLSELLHVSVASGEAAQQ